MVKALYAYQQEGARWLAEKGRGLLADEPGLGKTAQALEAAWLLGARRILVICPASVVDNWSREWHEFIGEAAFPPSVYSYDRALRSQDVINSQEWDCLVLDEAHYLKNPKAKRTQMVFGEKCDGVGGLVDKCRNVFALTGTPAPNNALELWPLMRAVFPKALRNKKGEPMTQWSFQTKFCVTKYNGFDIQVVGGKNLEALRDRLGPFVLRRKKADVLSDLPELVYANLVLSSETAAKALRAAEQTPEAAKIRKALEANEPFVALAKLGPEVASLRRLIGLAKVPVVVDWCRDWFDGGGGKLVLFAYHHDVIAALAVGLLEFGVCGLDGSTPSGERQRVVDKFQNDPKCQVFIGQITAAGVGITLTASSNTVFVESSWVPSDNEQAAMRIHRIGQKNACLVRFATLAGSLDEQIQRTCRRKLADTRRIFG